MVIEPCQHCGGELYDRVLLDLTIGKAICPHCEKVVEIEIND